MSYDYLKYPPSICVDSPGNEKIFTQHYVLFFRIDINVTLAPSCIVYTVMLVVNSTGSLKVIGENENPSE